jgi:hypothetical protein
MRLPGLGQIICRIEIQRSEVEAVAEVSIGSLSEAVVLRSGTKIPGHPWSTWHAIIQKQEFISKVRIPYYQRNHGLNKVAECRILNRKKDVGSATAKWFSELLSPNPWFKDVVPNV